jgi:hypothetical protein
VAARSCVSIDADCTVGCALSEVSVTFSRDPSSEIENPRSENENLSSEYENPSSENEYPRSKNEKPEFREVNRHDWTR